MQSKILRPTLPSEEPATIGNKVRREEMQATTPALLGHALRKGLSRLLMRFADETHPGAGPADLTSAGSNLLGVTCLNVLYIPFREATP